MRGLFVVLLGCFEMLFYGLLRDVVLLGCYEMLWMFRNRKGLLVNWCVNSNDKGMMNGVC
jgi:hypothetical protein